MNWLYYFEALAMGKRWAVRRLSAWLAIVGGIALWCVIDAIITRL